LKPSSSPPSEFSSVGNKGRKKKEGKKKNERIKEKKKEKKERGYHDIICWLHD